MKIVYNGLEINNINGFKVYRIFGLDSVQIRTSEDLLTGADGGAIWEQYYGMRTITIEGAIVAKDATEYHEKKSELVGAFSLNGERDMEITRYDGVMRTIKARVVSMPDIAELRDDPLAYANFQVQVRCAFPFFQDADKLAVIDMSTVGGYPVGQWIEVEEEDGEFDETTGMPVSTPIPFTGDTTDIHIDGQVATNPIYEIHGQIQNPSIINTSTGRFFSVNTNVTSGEVLRIQILNGVTTVTKSNANVIQFFDGDFVPLVPGVNTLRLTGSTFSGGVKCNVTYRNNFLSL